MNNHPIGIIDSGVGGLSIWKEIVKLLPHQATIYISDAKHLPYGQKSEEEVYRLAKRLVAYMRKQHVKLLVIACNTITVSAVDRLRSDFPTLPIVGTVPVVKAALGQAQGKPAKVGVLSTKRTAESTYVQNLIQEFIPDDAKVINKGTNALVPMVESGKIDQEVLRVELQPFLEAKVDVLALGCTHFPFLKAEIQRILGKKVQVLDSGEAVARQVKRILQHNQIFTEKHEASHSFLTTGEKSLFVSQINRLVGNVVGATIETTDL